MMIFGQYALGFATLNHLTPRSVGQRSGAIFVVKRAQRYRKNRATKLAPLHRLVMHFTRSNTLLMTLILAWFRTDLHPSIRYPISPPHTHTS
jgi:hypothetical protein